MNFKIKLIETEEARASIPNELNVNVKGGNLCDIYGSDLPQNVPVFVWIHGGYWQGRFGFDFELTNSKCKCNCRGKQGYFRRDGRNATENKVRSILWIFILSLQRPLV